MQYPISPLIEKVHFPPISEVQGWLANRKENPDQPLIDLCQAVPDYQPAPELTRYLSSMLDDPLTSRYSPDEGLPEVRSALCRRYEQLYGAIINPTQLCLTIGASQAFWLAMVTLCKAGDEVVIQVPYYFDHDMALAILGIKRVYAPFDESSAGAPSVSAIAGLITSRTRAIVMVNPSNPTGAVISPVLLDEICSLAARRGIALVLDETYADFLPPDAPPHGLFAKPDWGEHFIHLMSFGKTFALTGYRAGLLAAHEKFIHNALKAQDTMAVCQPRITQHAIRYGVDHLENWVRANQAMMSQRHDLFRTEFLNPGNPFQLISSGTFFGWIKHPYRGHSSREVARQLVHKAGILSLPGEVFGPGLTDYLRLAFGNISQEMIPLAVERFREVNNSIDLFDD